MTLIAQMGALLLQGAAAAESTIGRPVSAQPWYVTLNQIIGAASVIVFLVLMVILIPTVLKFRRTATKLDAVLDLIQRGIDPVSTHASNIADNIDYVTTSIRADVQDVRKTLLVANEGVRDLVDSTQRRMHELSAILRMVQEEAENAFVSTASTIRGVRAGAAAFREDGTQLGGGADIDDLGDDDVSDDIGGIDDDDDMGDDEDIETIDDLNELDDDLDDDTVNDLDAAAEAEEDMKDGYYNGTPFGRAEPRIKRPRRGGPG